jgi:HK97 family phage prohead protease/HK97 family phage major capsid protein
MMNRAYSLLEIKRADDETRTITGMATTPAPDRLQDVVEPAGAQFNLPLPLLWQHDSAQPIGHVTHAKIGKVGIEITAKMVRIAEPGRLKDRLDEAWQSIKTGLVGGLSIGFKALEHSWIEENKSKKGIRFIKWLWLELSVVTIPANNECSIETVKSIDTAQRAVSGQQTQRRAVSLNPPGASGQLQPKSVPKEDKMKTIAEQIAALEAKRQASAARMDAVMEKSLDEDRTTTAEEQEEFDNLSAEVEAIDKDLVRLRRLETAKAVAAKPVIKAETTQEGSLSRGGLSPVYTVPAKKNQPRDYVWNSLVCAVKGFYTQRSPYQILKEEYGDDESTRAVMNAIVTRAATVPADTVTSGWASQLVATSIQDYFGALLPMAVYPSLSAKGVKFSFGTAGIVTMPSRASTPTIAGSFVAQGAPIPVRQGAFTSISFTPKKMGVISTFTREIAEHSTPNIETLIREIIVEDTSVAIDTVLLDATAATTTRPAGLRAGVSVTPPTAGGGLAALIGDIRALTTALITGTNGNLRAPVWIMNPGDVLAASLIPAVAGGGEFPFKTELTAGTLQGYPVIQSATVPADMMFLLDAADFVSVTGDTPRFDVSNQATLHMEDTAPSQISTVGSPNVVAAPVRSLYQTDSIGVRMLLDLNWGLRRTGVVAWTQTMTWN